MCVAVRTKVAAKNSAAIFPHFCRSLATVTAMTKALQVIRVHEQSPVAPMGRDVINVGSADPSALSCAFPTKGFFQELHGPQFVTEHGQGIPPMPRGRFPAAPLCRLVLWAVDPSGQSSAPDVGARSQGLICHGLSPPRNTKKPERPDTPLWCIRWLRLKGSGAMQYSQRTPFCTNGSRPEGLPPSYPAALWRLFPVRKRDTVTIHPSWIFYHISFRFAIVSLPFSFRFPENIHYLKSEISARLSSFVPGGKMASRYSKQPYSLCRGLLSRIYDSGGSSSIRRREETHPV